MGVCSSANHALSGGAQLLTVAASTDLTPRLARVAVTVGHRLPVVTAPELAAV